MSQQPPTFGEVLATCDPRVWRILLAEHTRDEGGRCRVCRRSSGATEVWPCHLWCVADRARRIATG